MVQHLRLQNQIHIWKIQSLSFMLKLEYKSYIIGKKIGRDYCEDAIAVNLEQKRFAVADGVTNSFRPEIVSQYLVDKFVRNELSVSDWKKALYSDIGREMKQTWEEGVNKFLNNFEGIEKEIQELRMQNVGPGASTFCGVIFNSDNNTLDYSVLGDSCIFLLPNKGKYKVITSCVTQEEENGWTIDFTSTPDCIQVGNYEQTSEENWRIGSLPIHSGYVALMTDGASKWFYNILNSKEENETEQLWRILDTPQTFTEFVKNSRLNGSPLSDDVTILLIKVIYEDEEEYKQPDTSIYTEEEKKPSDKMIKVKKIISKILSSWHLKKK